jgi:hypothetical protein
MGDVVGRFDERSFQSDRDDRFVLYEQDVGCLAGNGKRRLAACTLAADIVGCDGAAS